MSFDTSLYQVIVSIESNVELDGEFTPAANTFLTALQGMDELSVQVPERHEPNSRGFVTLFSGIVVGGTKIGAFKAIYTLAKDLFDRSHNAEVELKFEGGSVLKLKGLTREEAERRMEQHLRKPVS